MDSSKSTIESIEKFNTKNYSIMVKTNHLTGKCELRIQSKSSGKNFAVHKKYNLIDDDGNIIKTDYIKEEQATFIVKNFEVKGDTESFNIYESDLIGKEINGSRKIAISPKQIRHKRTKAESSYTSTGEKLNYHWPIFEKYADTGYGSIIRATLTLHQVCASRCPYCSTIGRNKKDSISLTEAKEFVEKLYFDQANYNKINFPEYNRKYKEITGSDIRLRGLILSGGGQPNLWPHFQEFVEWLSELDIDLGLITNGFPIKIDEEIYKKFKWIRISITPEDASPHYIDNKFDKQYIPDTIIKNKNVTVGYSYVYGQWTDDDILQRIKDSMNNNGFDYCRLLTDCNLSRSSQLKAHQNLAEKLFRLKLIDESGNPLDKFFHQLKYHGDPMDAQDLWADGQCQLQIYNVFWDTTGHEDSGESYCYACDSITVLSEELNNSDSSFSERKFNHNKWGLVTNKEIDKLYNSPVKSYFDPKQVCTACLFTTNTKHIRNLTKTNDFNSLEVPTNLDHINFP